MSEQLRELSEMLPAYEPYKERPGTAVRDKARDAQSYPSRFFCTCLGLRHAEHLFVVHTYYISLIVSLHTTASF